MNNELKAAHTRLLTVAKTLYERVDDPEVALAAYESMQDELCAAWSLAEKIVEEREGEAEPTPEEEPEPDPPAQDEPPDHGDWF